ncbi:MAG: flagellar biosynthesis protein FlhF [Bdellovibrionaceae bacterium]|nr:flagellar biosynthesis protein FlhF [Pseudobdellovibrionaceae bacterium]
MQVRKFEARTMKDALEMVKKQLGPDAIILAAKDNSNKYGLVGESSFEITAAVSEETLHKKKFVESRMAENDKQQFQNSSARTQKEIISKFVTRHTTPVTKPVTTQKYIDINDEKNAAEERIKNAVQRAFDAGTLLNDRQVQRQTAKPTETRNQQVEGRQQYIEVQNDSEMNSLRSEIASLKAMIKNMQTPTESRPQSHYPGENYGIHYELSSQFQGLVKEGVLEDLAAEMILDLQNQVPVTRLKNKPLVEGFLAKRILEDIVVSSGENKKFHFFVGPSGGGKTSSIIKMASQLIVRENKKVALLTLDTQKVGAVEQLRIYSQILNVPFAVIRERNDWKEILKFINSIDYILIDTPGSNLKTQEEVSYFERMILKEIPSKSVHLVLSARNKYEDLQGVLNNFATLNVTDVIFNHLDETVQNGNVYSFNKINKLPLFAFGIGQRIPEDFEYATKERLVDLIFHITQKNNTTSEASL